MPTSIEDVETYLMRLNLPYEQLAPGVWMINDQNDHIENIVVTFSPPITIFRIKLMRVPKEHREELFHELLALNATDLVAGAYGVEGDDIVISDTLQSENLDYNEFQASVEALTMAVINHYPKLKKYFRGSAAA
jgi:hypothetical protein